jgi:hypothetical protein
MNAITTLLSINSLQLRYNAGTKQLQYLRTGANLQYDWSITFYKPGTGVLFNSGTLLLTNNTQTYFSATGLIDAVYTAVGNGGRYEVCIINNLTNLVSFRCTFYYSSITNRAGAIIDAIL